MSRKKATAKPGPEPETLVVEGDPDEALNRLLKRPKARKEPKMAKNEKTSGKVAKIASQGLKAPSTLTSKQIKTLSGSVLTQTSDKKKK
jgi:hypothetical protein